MIGKLVVVLALMVQVFQTEGSDQINNYAGVYSTTGSSSGDGGPSTSASFYYPLAIWRNTAGTVYVTEDGTYKKIRTISSTGIVNAYFGSTTQTVTNGVAATSAGGYPWGVWSDTNDNVYFSNSATSIRKIDTSNIVSAFAGGGSSTTEGVAATSASFAQMYTVIGDTLGNMYALSAGQYKIKKIAATTFLVTTFGGTGSGSPADTSSVAGDGGQASSARLYSPQSAFFDTNNFMYVSSLNGGYIRKINMATGIMTRVAGGSGSQGYTGDYGPATNALLSSGLSSIAGDSAGSIYYSSFSNYVIRYVDNQGIIAPYAGTNTVQGHTGDGGAATSATLKSPFGISCNGDVVLMCDYYNNVVRSVGIAADLVSVTYANFATDAPTVKPTAPTQNPTVKPTTLSPSVKPTSSAPTTLAPTEQPTVAPSNEPTSLSAAPSVSIKPTESPTVTPTVLPSELPTVLPSIKPTVVPSVLPTVLPTLAPTVLPTVVPSVVPTVNPTILPTAEPSLLPSVLPSVTPTQAPSVLPSMLPSAVPTLTFAPSDVPTVMPTAIPTVAPSTAVPSVAPTDAPSVIPTVIPTAAPSMDPVDISFDADIYLHNVTVSVLDSACQNAVSKAVAVTLDIDDDQVVFLSQDLIGSERRRLSASRYQVMVSVNVWASTLDFPEVSNNATQLYRMLSTTLTDAVDSNSFTATVRNVSAALHAVGTLYVGHVNLTVASYSVVTDDDVESDSSDNNALAMSEIAGIVIGAVAFVSMVLLLCFYCAVKKHKHDRKVHVDA